AASGADPVAPWAGSGLSLYWLGLTCAATVGLEALGRTALVPGLIVGAAAAVAVGPLAVGHLTGGVVVAGDGRTLPALVVAESAADPDVGTLVLTTQEDGSVAVRVERGAGSTLDRM